jgi:hypothetical protein
VKIAAEVGKTALVSLGSWTTKILETASLPLNDSGNQCSLGSCW